MSDRSAKLLLDVAQMIEAKVIQEPHAFRKMGGGGDSITFRAGLVTEVQQWARGYQEHIDKKVALKKEGPRFTSEMTSLILLLNGITAVMSTLMHKEHLGFDEVRDVSYVLGECQKTIRKQIEEKSNG